ncbi:MAG: 4-(cytidine 5'-diphospho)-2-C-methyl-D-erythritol kinase [Lachnospiraceae bacterium]|jgi:4-diphosphocytidyl-2-C-methyl-D-erythritol kinase|nr:4-(cytidine 5'-diphospho)-2-C-methyl-D-erythritol kinase [Lachnospiraceae bacterium]
MIEHLELRAYGKINLGLDVVKKREDGYHEVRMIMQTVGLYDKIIMERRRRPGIRVETNLPYVPSGEGNLAWRAAKLLTDEFGLDGGVYISVWKKIPVAGGMAGGSTDAAAVLVGMNRLFRLGLTKRALMERGVSLGADVPYCILRGTALSEGIGERLSPLPPAPDCSVLLAKPQISVSTKAVYGSLKVDELLPSQHPDIDGMAEAIREENLDGVIERLGNVLETVTIPAHPEIGRIKEHMLKNGADGALMSGSGPTVFGLFKEQRAARDAFYALREAEEGRLVRQVYLTRLFRPGGSERREGRSR